MRFGAAARRWVSGLIASLLMLLVGPAASAWGDPCPEDADRDCAEAVSVVHDRLTGGAVVAAPLTRPGVEAPLGWTLSDESRHRLRDGVTQQREDCREDRGAYACLEELLALVGRR